MFRCFQFHLRHPSLCLIGGLRASRNAINQFGQLTAHFSRQLQITFSADTGDPARFRAPKHYNCPGITVCVCAYLGYRSALQLHPPVH